MMPFAFYMELLWLGIFLGWLSYWCVNYLLELDFLALF